MKATWSVMLTMACCLASGPWLSAADGNTVSGVVFRDANGNGQQDADENGLAEVAVSDGARIVHTDARGWYQLTDIPPESRRFVFMTTPAGYTAWNRFYAPLPTAPATLTANFALAPSPAAGNPVFTFAQVSDFHVENAERAKSLVEDLREVESWNPDFIVSTGDQVSNGGNAEEFESYKAALREAKRPVISLMGNHDKSPPWNSTVFEHAFGPSYYSFDYGSKHCIVLNCATTPADQAGWLEQDLAAQSTRGLDVLVFQHWGPDEKLLALLQRYKVQAIFFGHWHSSRVVSCGGVLSVSSPTLRMGGIDLSPRGFRLITCSAGKLELTSRSAGCRELCTLVRPADGASVPAGVLPVTVAVYDSTMPVTGVAFRLNDGAWQPLVPDGRFNWRTETPVGLGPQKVEIQARLGSATVWQRQAKFSAVPAASLPRPEPGQAWPMFHRDIGRTGATAEAVIPPLHLAWSTNVGGITHLSSPVVSGRTLYIGTADDDAKGRAGICALDAITGTVQWRYPTATSLRHTVTVDARHCYGVTVDGLVIAVARATGKLVWQHGLGTDLERWCQRWVMAPPLVDGDRVYVGVEPYFVALDAGTGQELWRTPGQGSDFLPSLNPMAGDADRLYVQMNYAKGVVALDRKTGLRLWHTPEAGSPVCWEGKLALSTKVLNASSGAVVWSSEVMKGSAAAAIAGNTLVVGRIGSMVLAFDGSTGKKKWSYQFAQPAKLDFRPYQRASSAVFSAPAIAAQTVYCAGTNGQFVALELQTGKPVWNYDLGSPITASPAISGNSVYVATYDGTVYAFSAPLQDDKR